MYNGYTMRKIGKHGNFLTEHLLSIILAAVCLFLLGYLVYIYYKDTLNNEYKSANTILDTIEKKASKLSGGQLTHFPAKSFLPHAYKYQ